MPPLLTKVTLTRAQIAVLPDSSSGPIDRAVVTVANKSALVQVGGETIWEGPVDGVEIIRPRREWAIIAGGETLFTVTRSCGCGGR